MSTQSQPLEKKSSGIHHFFLNKENLEAPFVLLTAIAILLSAVGTALAWPATLILLINIASYVFGGFFGTKQALESLSKKRIDVDMLMILAALGAASIGNWPEGAILLFLFSLSNVLQDYAIGRSRKAIHSLLKLYPETANVRRNDRVIEMDIKEIRMGDIVLIKPGERIPVDGIVISGQSALDQSAITGESIPVDKSKGDKLFAGTLNMQGILDMEARETADNTTLARIIQLVENAQETKAPTERFLDRFEQFYATFILAFIGLFIIIPPFLGWIDDFQAHFYRAMVLMTVASPCALVISVPSAYIAAIASGARAGILFKGSNYLELLAQTKVIAFDKTGTLTIGQAKVQHLASVPGVSEDELLQIAASVEARSEHPLAKAIVQKAAEAGLELEEVEAFEAITGKGLQARLNNREIHIGSLRYAEQIKAMPPSLKQQAQEWGQLGQTIIAVLQEQATGYEYLGIVAIADQMRPEMPETIAGLTRAGIHSAMLTGDQHLVAEAIAKEVGIEAVYAELMPEDKVRILEKLREEYGSVSMIGDGVNDAPALAVADVGIAMGLAGSDTAMETADIVLMGDRIDRIQYAIELSQSARRVVIRNIIFSLAVIVMLIIGVFVIDLPLPLGVLGHEGSTVIVVVHSLIFLLLIPEIKRRRLGSS
ncbi:hypothetical protein MASR2M15_04360 [Anaerolineales bacterium]